MKKQQKMYLTVCTASFIFCAANTVPTMAATRGDIISVSSDSINGWAWEVGEFDTTLSVEVQISETMDSEPVETLSGTADQFSQEVQDSINDGWHAFSIPIDWDSLGDGTFFVRAYSVKGETKSQLGSTFTYDTAGEKGERIIAGPGDLITLGPDASEPAESSLSDSQESDVVSEGETSVPYTELTGDETFLGEFTVTGYCGCNLCSAGHNMTYSGTVPKANHTLSADLDILPIGSKVWIDGIIYTVEDKGGAVSGQKVDIFYDNHEAAVAHGKITADVYLVS